MSLRKSPTRTPALLAANRRNARKSTGPRTAQGKAWSRLNSLREGQHSRELRKFTLAILDSPPGLMGVTAKAILNAQMNSHPLFIETAAMAIEVENELIEEFWARQAQKEKEMLKKK